MHGLTTTLGSHWRSAVAGLLLLGAASASVALLWPRPSAPVAVITPLPRPTASPAPLLAVHVTGAVANPGVYRLQPGTRAEDAIAAAGGLIEEADASSLNLAAHLADGQQLFVKPKAALERGSAPGGESRTSRLNLNAASVADLDALPGIGPVLAQRIVERRQRAGFYVAVEQLRDEKIIPASLYERIKDLVSVD